MKKIIKPAEKEEAIFYTDFKGKFCDPSYGTSFPPVELVIEFNYGSVYDGERLSLHLDDEEILPILDMIKHNMSEDYKKSIEEKLKKREKNFEDSMQMRDWDACDYENNSLTLLRYMLNLKEE